MNTLDRLQAIWHRDIPITAAMGVTVASFDNDELRIAASLAANVNVHGSAFAGSLYSICALAGWGMSWLQLERRNIDANIVLARAKIDYVKAIESDIDCRCTCDASALEPCFEALANRGRTRFELDCEILTGAHAAVRFSGTYAIRVV